MSMVGTLVVVACGVTLVDVAGLLLIVAAAAGVLVPDLRERLHARRHGQQRAGRSGRPRVGQRSGADGEWIALAVVVGLNLLSEKVSFSRVIDATPALRWFDRLGSLR